MPDFKRLPVIKTLYRFPGLVSSYHFLWAWTGAAMHRAPGKELFVIGVTGTKGKTTTLELINAILEAAGKRTALLSSLRVKVAEESAKNMSGNSMPGHGYIQEFLRRAARAKCDYALIEVTSQGVAAHRHRFIPWRIGALTNLAPEHIESHGSFENYRAAKLGFLQYVLRSGGQVFLNRDGGHFDFFVRALGGGGTVTTSKSDNWLTTYLPEVRQAALADGNGRAPRFLLSEFNEENIAIAVAIGQRLGVPDLVIEDALKHFAGVPGRMEFVTYGPYTAVVDYAHTPDSLEAAYKAVKPVPSDAYPDPRLIAVLGAAGGGRDRWKRKAMGAVAARYCDELMLTDEDPYDETWRTIIDDLKSGILESDRQPRDVYEITSRREAIRKAVELAREGDIIIGTGKGSEDWIHLAKGKKIPWNERKAFEELFAEAGISHGAKGSIISP